MRVLALAREDLRLTLRDRSSIFWIFVAPLLWVYFFGVMSGSSQRQVTLELTVVVQEASPLAERFVGYLRGENFEVTVVSPGAGLPAESASARRKLTIPTGFADAVAARRKVALDLWVDSKANPEGTFAVRVALHKAIVRLLASEAFGGLEPGGDLVRVRSEWAAGREIPSGVYQSIPGNLVMFVLIATMTYGAALLALERRNGLLRRLAASPLSRAEIILGHLLGRAAIAAVQVGVFLVIGLFIFRIDWGSSPVGLALLLTCLIGCASALSLLGGTLFASPEAASGIGVVLTLFMSALGGCWWPAEIMPQWLRIAGHAFPTAWAMDGLHEIISWRGGLRDVLVPCAVLILYAVGSGLLATRRLRFSG